MIASDLTFWKEYELSVDLKLSKAQNGLASSVLQFSDPGDGQNVGERITSISIWGDDRVQLCYDSNGHNELDCYNTDAGFVPWNQWFNLKLIQVFF